MTDKHQESARSLLSDYYEEEVEEEDDDENGLLGGRPCPLIVSILKLISMWDT